MSRLAWLLLSLLAVVASATAEPGATPPSDSLASVMVSMKAPTSLQPFYAHSGKIHLSTNAIGRSSQTSYSIDIDKPSAAATVRDAFLLVATTPRRSIANLANAIQLEGNSVPLGHGVSSSFNSNNYRGDAKAAVSPTLNAAAPGIVALSVKELSPVSAYDTDGIILVVIWDEPSAPPTTVILLYGSQNTAGDTFALTFGDPLGDLSNKQIDMSVGISFGYQTATYMGQSSIIEVNGQRLTSTAGGQDDGQGANGALITVGGLGDSNDNPASPNLKVDVDDELYSLLPFLQPSDTGVMVFTKNPSNDDNIFFASFKLANVAAIVGEGIVLGPLSDSNTVGSSATVTATIKDDNNNAVVGKQVDFSVTAGPNAGKSFSANTDGSGKATWTYTDTGGAGTDTVVASFTDSQSNVQTSNQAVKIWVAPPPPTDCSNKVTCMPSFESDDSDNCQFPVYGKFCLLQAPFHLSNDQDQVCWKVHAGEVDWKNSRYWAASHGDKSIDLNGRTAGHLVSKVYNLEAGVYHLSFDLSGNMYGDGDKTLKAQILEARSLAVLGEEDFVHAQTASVSYNREIMEFTLDAAAAVQIGFLSTSGDNCFGPVIDNVDLRFAACPAA